MGIRRGQLLDAVINESTAIKCVIAAVIYCIGTTSFIMFYGASSERLQQEDYTCDFLNEAFSPSSRRVYGLTIIMICILIAIFQVSTFRILQKRLNLRVAPDGHDTVGNRNNSLNKLYKKALKNSTLIAIAYMVGWLPVSLVLSLFDWQLLDRETLVDLGFGFAPLTLIQAICNALIFRAKHITDYVRRVFRRRTDMHVQNLPMANV